jgi:hypothetical protein
LIDAHLPVLYSIFGIITAMFRRYIFRKSCFAWAARMSLRNGREVIDGARQSG